MPKQIGSNEMLALRQVNVRRVLKDTCEVYTPNRISYADGTWEDGVPTALTYEGSTNIPCRLDVSRHYRSGTLADQEMTINEFELVYPHDFDLKSDHKIIFKGHRYEVRKLLDDYSFAVTRSATVSRVDIGTTGNT